MALDLPADLTVIRDHWPDALDMTDAVMTRYVQAAETQVLAWAPTGWTATATNPGHVLAVAWAARDASTTGERDGDLVSIGDGQTVRVRPLSDAVKAQLRPARAVPGIG